MLRKISLFPSSNLFSFLLAIFALVGAPARIHATAVGLSQGKISADASGGAGYQMPIIVSPGTAGIQPKLSFQYSSGGRNGALGMGWAVAGVSSITRAPQTLAQDPTIHGVDLTLNDRYAMDGQRLILIGGSNGGAGSEYRTEINSFTKVIANSQSGNGPSTFTAWTKSGLIYTFGGANGASYIPAGVANGTVLTWFLSKVQDQAGNYMTFSYTAEGNLSSINYTMNDSASLGSYASVAFTYDSTRPDPAIGYVAGSPITMNQRLSRVTSSYSSQIVRQYDLAYEVSANTGKSRLISITEGTGSESFPPTLFTWDNDPDSVGFANCHIGNLPFGGAWVQGDFNGDGACDFGKIKDNKINIYSPQTCSSSPVPAGTTNISAQATDDTWLQGDFNGDGKVDIARVYGPSGSTVKIKLFLNAGTTGSGTTFTEMPNATFTAGAAGTFKPQRSFIAMDVNGDGRLDIVNISGVDDNGNAQQLAFTVYLNNPNGNQPGTFVAQPWLITHIAPDTGQGQADYARQSDRWFVGDFNGDGLPDLAKLWGDSNKQSVRVYLNQNGSYQSAQWINQYKSFYKSDGTTQAYLWSSGDFNGDGLMDLVCVPKFGNPDNSTSAVVFLSTGSVTTKFATPQAWLPLVVGGVHDDSPAVSLQVGDYNADGRSDLIVTQESYYYDLDYQPTPRWMSSINLSYYFSDGAFGFYFGGQYAPDDVPSLSNISLKKWLTADFNGDGKEDLIHIRNLGSSSEIVDIHSSAPGYQDLMRKVTDGMGVATSITYQPLTAAGVYTPNSNAVAPAIDLIVPMPVVTDITYDNGLGAIGSSGSNYSVSYKYEGLKADPKRGLLGFRSVEAIDNRPVDNPDPTQSPTPTPDGSKGLRTKSWFIQGFPFTGMAERAITYLTAPGAATKSFTDNTGLLSLSTSVFANGPTENAAVYFPYAQDSHVYSYDLNGKPTNDTETIVQRDDHAAIDAYGNTWGSVVKTKALPSTTDFFQKTTKSDYTVSTPNWRLGQITGSSVKSEAPGQPAIIRTSGFGYNSSNGEVGSETVEPGDPSWMTTTYQYDAFGNAKVATVSSSDNSDPLDVPYRITETDYDARGRFVHQTTNPMGHTEIKLYDERFGAVNSVTGPNGLTDTAVYDGFSRKISSTRADGVNTVTHYEWVTPGGLVPLNAVYQVRVTPEDGPESITYFDRLGREMRRRSIAGNGQTVLADTTYDYRGRKQTVTKPYFSGGTPIFATTLYDALDRVRQVITPSVDETGTAVLAYLTQDYDGLIITATNPKGQSTISTNDATGHVHQVQDALNGTITYTYDALGELIQTADAASPPNVTTITYDVRGRKTSVNDPDLGLWHYTYYATGELQTQTDAKNQEVSFEYDQLSRLTRRADPTGDVTMWYYDNYTDDNRGIGKLYYVSFTPAMGSSLAPYSNTITYDELGRPSSQSTLISGITYVTGTEYDEFSRVSKLIYPTGFAVTQLYNENGYLTDIQSDSGRQHVPTSIWTARDYDADGHITEEAYGNGIVTDRVYIPQNGLLKTITSGIGANTDVQNLEYNFDVLGNLKQRTDHNQTVGGNTLTETFNYDNLNRLQNSTATGQAQQNFTYNILGNITHKDGAGDYTYDTAHKHAVHTVNGGAAIVYDGNGNMTSGLGRSLTWTWFNMPERIQNTSASSDFTYDPDHNRITQRAASGGSLVVTTYVGGFFERVDDGTLITEKSYINAPTGRVAIYTETYDPTQFDTVGSGVFTYLHKDHLGSIDVITDASGAVLERDSFDAWGARRQTDWQKTYTNSGRSIFPGSIVTRGFTDHEELDAFNLVHMNGRIYDPGIGRFLSADPFVQAPTVTQNFNRYSYVVNNPLSLSDPSGFNIFGDFFKWLSNTFGHMGAQIIVAVASIAIGIVTAGAFTAVAGAMLAPGYALTGLGTAIVGGAGFGFGAGFSSTIMAGGSIGQAFQAGAIGALIGGMSGGIAKELGDIPGANDMFSLGHLGQTVGHAVLGGTVSEIQNGDFESGALAAGISAAFSPAINMIGDGAPEYKMARVAVSAAIGGTASELGGGKFANGAVTAAFMRLYNDEILEHEWNVGKATLGPLTHIAMNHADGTSAGDWYLTSGDVDRLKQSPGYDQLIRDMKAYVLTHYDGAADGKYSLSMTDSITFGKYSDAYYAVGSARFWISGSVTVLDGKAYWNAQVTMYDWFSFTTEGSMKAIFLSPTWTGRQLQLSGFLHPFSTNAFYSQSVSQSVIMHH